MKTVGHQRPQPDRHCSSRRQTVQDPRSCEPPLGHVPGLGHGRVDNDSPSITNNTRPATLDDLKLRLRSLNAHGIEYFLVGGYALAAHRYPRATADIGVVVLATNQRAGDSNPQLLTALVRLEQPTITGNCMCKAILIIILSMGLAMQGCAAVWPTTSGTRHYFEKKDGTRYYSLGGDRTVRSSEDGEFKHISEGFIWVLPDGTVNAPGHTFTSKATKSADGDWSLHEYPIESPNGYCIPLWSSKIDHRPESCWNRLWEVPSMIIGVPILFAVMLVWPTPR